MIAVDLDGTLLNSRKRISEEDAEALRAAAARGVEIVPVTGRNFNTALPIVQDLLTTGPLISSNGAIIRSKTGETFLRNQLPGHIAAEVLRATREFRPYTVLMYDQPGEGQFRIEVAASGPGDQASPPDGVAASPWVRRFSAAVRFTDALERELAGDPLEIMFAGPLNLMQEVAGRLDGDPASAATFRLLRTQYPAHNFSILDVIREDCSKGHAIAYWSRFRGIARDEIMAIGDNFNDLEMLRFAGVPVVMGNAEECLKQEGWPVTLDCDSGGVARAIERFVL